MKQLTNDWQQLTNEEMQKPYFIQLEQFLAEQYATQPIFPAQADVFQALEMTAYKDVKVVLLGQDPYHGANQAHGLSFSVQKGVKIPPSLRNMYKELQAEFACEQPDHGDLTSWAKQGVLLLNTVLTVQEGKPGSHQGKGWEQFTDYIIEALVKREQPVVFLLWGKHAQAKRKLIEKAGHHIMFEAPHPSPLSAHRGFFGSKPFSQANAALQAMGRGPIHWCITSEQGKLF